MQKRNNPHRNNKKSFCQSYSQYLKVKIKIGGIHLKTKWVAFLALIFSLALGIFVGSVSSSTLPKKAEPIEETTSVAENPKYILKGYRESLQCL